MRDRAYHFVHEHKEDSYEKGQTQLFWRDFFDIFGISIQRVASFEKQVKKLGERQGFMDCFWPGKLLIEHKSKGKNLDLAFDQAIDYFPGLTEDEIPNYILVSDFETFRLYDLSKGTDFYQFTIDELPSKLELFYFILDRDRVDVIEEDPVNIKASKLMGSLYDTLDEIGYRGHDLEIFLVRVLFCLFAEDTQIFERRQFENFVRYRTHKDGSDLGARLDELFEVLNTPLSSRLTTRDEELNAFVYINGKLFSENIRKSAFNSNMRKQLLECCEFDWSQISPAIFGNLFQYVMDPEKREVSGSHYTDEKNIFKLIKPLFLDALWDEYNTVLKERSKRKRIEKLHQLQDKLSQLKIFDPACGCGNFLVVSYRELRRLELKIVHTIREMEYEKGKSIRALDISSLFKLDVNQFYGIEIIEFSAKISEVSLWLTDHLMNVEASADLGQNFSRIPLHDSANITCTNALTVNWGDTLSAAECSYIVGNPPFYGKQEQEPEQKAEMSALFAGVKGAGVLDYVSGWYKKASEYIDGTDIEVGFVSTNSIAQGEQVGVLFGHLSREYGIHINFAHQAFKWSNQASGVAQVFVIIIGFSQEDKQPKLLYEYENSKAEPLVKEVDIINSYLVNAPQVFIDSRRKPINDVPEIKFGNMPNDGGNFLFEDDEKEAFLAEEPQAEEFFRPLISNREYLYGVKKWCLWLKDASPARLHKCPKVIERIKKVKAKRLESKRETTKKLAEYPTLFGEIRQPESNFILIPLHSSEFRKYIPMGFFQPNYIVHNSCSCIPDASLYHFGILTSAMHMAWVSYVCGRIKGDYRYSNTIVYNNFPWAEEVTVRQKAKIEELAQRVLDIRNKYIDSAPADLYNQTTMPVDLRKAHIELDKAVDKLYRSKSFKSDGERVSLLFTLYNQKV